MSDDATPTTTPPTDPHALAAEVKRRARELGFDLVGICPATPSAYRDYLRQWLDDGRQGSMDYLSRRFEERTDPARYFPGARSVVCVALNYYADLDARTSYAGVERPGSRSRSAAPNLPAPTAEGRIARYALGDDYHDLIKDRLYVLADWLRRTAGGETRCGVDTAPLMEKELAARAGVGWVGKNTCLINENIGSWLLLGEVLTTVALPFDAPGVDRCGTCRRCIDACPTGAITAPYQLDARRCISYLTIEHRGEIEPALRPRVGDWLYGCDVCQDVCPWNSKAVAALDPALAPRFPTGALEPHAVADWSDEDYRRMLKGSAMKRVKLPQLKRNATIVRSNLEGHE
jgi:epoxyqueuosine reductase